MNRDVPPENSILYELLVYSEWKLEPELPKIFLPSTDGLAAVIKNLLPFFHRQDTLEDNIRRLLSRLQPWRLAVGDGGKVVAIIQDGSLEILTSRDEYSSVMGKAGIPKDPFPQWRRWCWSPDCSILAVGFSNGTVRAYDLMGSNLFNIYPPNFEQEHPVADTSHALAACFFIQARVKTHKWSSELVTVDYSGELRSYLASPTEGYQENHTFSLSRYYRRGVTVVAYHSAHAMLFVAGVMGMRNDPFVQETGSGVGITAWRILNDHPYYQLVSSDKRDGALLPDSVWNRLPSIRFRSQQSVVVRMEVSPSGRFLAALHSCGGISVWHLPGIKRLGFWPLVDQPGWDTRNPFATSVQPQGAKCLPATNSTQPNVCDDFYPVDLDWWSDDAVVVSRRCGSVSVCNIENMQNMLGESPEFLAGAAQVKRFHNEKGFLALECDVEPVGKNRNSDISLEDEIPDDSVEDLEELDEVAVSLFSRISMILNSAVYLVTDMERFRPRRKRLRLCRRTYRLLALRSTTPEELFTRKLDNGDYGEALTLAHTYNLDCDLVYQRQWRNSKVSIASIRDYLSKVSKRTWALRECVERIPESLSAARELVDFGLKATSKDTIRTLGTKRKLRDIDDWTEEQQEFLILRRTLLRYQDRLFTYEKMLGGPQLADELFDHTFYAEFRSSSSLQACVRFARAGNWQAVESLLTYHGGQTMQHWLPILSNFPETVCPIEYKSLLPECSVDGFVLPLEESSLRELDWSEKEPYSSLQGIDLDTSQEDNEYVYQYEPGLSAYRVPVNELRSDLVTQWYHERIRTIERSSRMVDNALILLRLARDRNVEGLESLHQELLTLDALVYELLLEDISLADLEKKSSLEKCKLLMSKTEESTFITDLNELLFPFLRRVEKHCPGEMFSLLHDYLVGVATQDLALPLMFFEEIHEQHLPLEISTEEVMSLAIACLYAYVDTDQLPLAQRILACVPANRGSSEVARLADLLDVLEMELAACLILQRNHTPKSLGFIRDNKEDSHTASQLLTRMARTVASSYTTPNEDEWNQLLTDILDLQHSVFPCVPLNKCYEIFSSTLLVSGDVTSICMAKNTLDCGERAGDMGRTGQVDRVQSRALILAAAREYMDSAGSLIDPAMELAKTCLHLVEYEDEEVQEELNLVLSFQLLHDFGISILPLQVRLCPDRLRLIEECLKKKKKAYRNSHRLIQLAAYLNICGNDSRQRQGRVLVLTAECAFAAKDVRCCAEICQRLMAAEYAPGWLITSQLGRYEKFTDISLRAQLLAFALQHCPADVLSKLIDARCAVEVTTLQHFVSTQVSMHSPSLSETEEVIDKADASPFSLDANRTSDFLTSLQTGEAAVRETTQRLLRRVGDSEFWKKAFQIGWESSSNEFECGPVDHLSQQSCHTFYASLYHPTPCTLSVLGPRYDSLVAPDVPPRLRLGDALLRASLLEQAAGLEQPNITNVILECALSLLPEDNCLALAHLLSLPEDLAKEASQKVFGTNLTVVSLLFAQYHSALLGFRHIVGSDEARLRNVFLYDPNEVIAGILKCKEAASEFGSMLEEWSSRLEDFVEAQELLKLGCGVDLDRFSHDVQYQCDSILGLAMSEEQDRLRLALDLAARHGVERGQVIAEHVSSLLLCDQPSIVIKERLTTSPLSELMSEAADDVSTKLENTVLPSLSGKQHETLELFYTVINEVAPERRVGRLLSRDHLKLLTRVKSLSADIDYKLLISGPKHTLPAIQGSLTLGNINQISKLLKALPPMLANPLTPSQLYSVFICEKLKESSEAPSLQTVKEISPLLGKMAPNDIVSLMEKLCYPTEGHKASVELVEDLLELAVLCCERAVDAQEVGTKTAVASDDEWGHSLQLLLKWRDHIRASKSLLQTWPQEPLCRFFVESRGDYSGLPQAMKEALLSPAVSLDLILAVNRSLSPTCSFTIEELLMDSLKATIESLGKPEDHTGTCLSTVLLRLEELLNQGELVNPSWSSLVHSLATLDNLSPDLQLRALNLLQLLSSEVSDGTALILPHTKAVIASAWSTSMSVNLEDVLEEGRRADLFFKLLEETVHWNQRETLRKLLDLWPPFSKSENRDVHEEVTRKFLIHCMLCENGSWSDHKAKFIMAICKQNKLEASLVKLLLDYAFEFTEKRSDRDSDDDADCHGSGDDGDDDDENMKVIDVQLLILVCLLCEDPSAHRMSIALAQQHLMEPFHDCVAELALSRNLMVHLISTPAYSGLLSKIMEKEPELAPNLIRELRSHSYFAEAGSVILQSVKHIPHFMRTFSAATFAGLGDEVKIHGPQYNSNKSEDRAPSNNSDIQKEDDWDASDSEWSPVGGAASNVKSETKERSEIGKTESVRSANKAEGEYAGFTQLSAKASEKSGWDVEGDWEDWPDEEPKDTSSTYVNSRRHEVNDTHKKDVDRYKRNKFSPEKSKTMKIGSPNSAFVTVPQREHPEHEEESGSTERNSTTTTPTSHLPPSASNPEWDEGWVEEWSSDWE